MKKITKLVLFLVVVLALTPVAARAQTLDGSIWAAQGAAVPVFFNFSVSGETFVATILTFGNGGNGRWFAAFGSTNGVSGTGQVLLPTGFALAQPAGASLVFQLDGPDAAGGSFATTGLDSFLSVKSGRFGRVFP